MLARFSASKGDLPHTSRSDAVSRLPPPLTMWLHSGLYTEAAASQAVYITLPATLPAAASLPFCNSSAVSASFLHAHCALLYSTRENPP